MSGSLSVSLRQLAVSNCLEKCTFSINDFSNDSFAVGGVTNQRCVNAAKVSLLLVQTLAACFDEDEGVVDTDDVISSLTLDNIIVQVSSSSIHELAENECGKVCEESDHAVLGVNEGESTPMDFNTDPFENDTPPLDFLSSIFDTDGNNSGHGNNDILLETSEESSSLDENNASLLRNERQTQSPHSNDKDIFDSINASIESGVEWTILGMKIIPSKTDSSKSISAASSKSPDFTHMMQHIGIMIYEVFSPKESQSQTSLPTIFKYLLKLEGESCLGKGCNNETDVVRRRSKLQRHKEKSLFADLLETGLHSVSICRMLSDMIDIGPDGMAESPYTTLKDVVHDLEQMVSQPLDNPKDDGSSFKLHFGSSLSGRTEHVTNILKATSRMQGGKLKTQQSPDCVEAIFISGVGGIGKSFLLQSVGNYLKSQGWLVFGAKFEEGLEHEARHVTMSAFDRLLSHLVRMRDGDEDDIKYSRQVTEVVGALDSDDLSSLATFIPSIHELIDNIEIRCGNVDGTDSGNLYWRLVFLLSSLLGAVLSLGKWYCDGCSFLFSMLSLADSFAFPTILNFWFRPSHPCLLR